MQNHLAERIKANQRTKSLWMESFFTGSILVGALLVLVVVAGFLVVIS